MILSERRCSIYAKTILRKRDLYLNRIIAFQDTEMIKVMTGIRRCGKSSLMKLMAEHLRETGVTDDQIIEMNLSLWAFRIWMQEDSMNTSKHAFALINGHTSSLMRYRKCMVGKMQ